MTAIEALDRELARLHEELSSFTSTGDGYGEVLREISRVNTVLAGLAMQTLVIVLLVLAAAGIGSFFVLPAGIAWVGWLVFGLSVLGLLITAAVNKAETPPSE